MTGTRSGGIKVAEKMGKEFYSKIGTKGGSAKVKKGFATNPALARLAGQKGGRISRRK